VKVLLDQKERVIAYMFEQKVSFLLILQFVNNIIEHFRPKK